MFEYEDIFIATLLFVGFVFRWFINLHMDPDGREIDYSSKE